MKDELEKLTHMELLTWLSVIIVSVCATVVRLLVEAEKLSLRGFIAGSFMAAFLGFLTALYCLELEVSEKMMGVIVGLVTYQAVNILTGLGRLGSAFAKDPIALAGKLRNFIRGGK